MTLSVPSRSPESTVSKHLSNENIQSKTRLSKTKPNTDAISESVRDLCVSWEVNTDEWWTHHPDFRISLENETHYCFRPLPSEKAQLTKTLYDVQFQLNCSKTFTKTMWSSGWGADWSNVVDGLKFAHENRRPFSVYTPSSGWHYASKDGVDVCEKRDMSCYFLNLTNCPPIPSVKYGRQSYLSGGWKGFHLNRDFLEYATRPQTWLRKLVFDFVKPYEEQLLSPCTVLHVRRGDVVLLDSKPRRYHAIAEYMNKHNNVSKYVLLLTDDENAVGEALHEFPNHSWVYINRTRYKGAEGGWENHIPSNDPKQEVVVLLSALKLARKCEKMVHSKSNLADLIYSEMEAAQPGVTRINLDQGKGLAVHNEENVHSVNISKTYNNVI